MQIHSESAAANKTAQWRNWEGCLENKEEAAMGDGLMHLWFSNQHFSSPGLFTLFFLYISAYACVALDEKFMFSI